MSDKIEDVKRIYQKHVRDGCAMEIGLFSIPEYPENEYRKGGMWSTALKIILTTLRILAPATLLTLFWGHNSFLFRILKQIDIAIKTIIYSSEDQKESIVKWLSETGPIKVDTLDTVWNHGWIVCGVLDAAMPGACAGHPPTTLSMKHAQTIADHYLGVEPVFTKQELESEDKLSKYQEWKLAQYLDRIREALSRIPTPVSKPCSQRTSPEIPHFTMDYTAKGSGLAAAQINSKMFFKIYPTTAQQSLEPGEIKVLIKGPKDKYGLALIPPIMGKAQSLRQELLDLEQKPEYTHSKLPLIQGTTYLRSYGKNDMSKMYHIPKSQYDIKIEVEIRPEYAKVGYTVDSEGRYEIFITSRGQNIVGSPFTVPASYNIIDDLENDSSCLEDGEEIDIIDLKTDRKVVLRIVDFVSEKMLLKEDGELEKITDEQAELLMKTEKEDPVVVMKILDNNEMKAHKIQEKDKKVHFRLLSNKLIIVLRFCRVLKENKKPQGIKSTDNIRKSYEDHKEIPDLINSTFNETYLQQHSISERLDSRSYKEERKSLESEYFDTNEKSLQDIERNSLEKMRSLSPNNPFINDIIRENTASTSSTCPLDFPSLDDIPIKILIDEDNVEQEPVNTNPFIDPEILQIERPKTPVLKIITGEVKHRDTIYVDPRFDKMEESIKSNEFINPFYQNGHLLHDVEDTPVTDFIIGAPVTLPPIVKTSTPEPTVESIMYTCPEESYYESSSSNNITRTEYSSQLNELNLNVHDLEEVTPKKQEDEAQNVTIKRDMWDSAYVSIDDSNSSPDSNNNDNLSNEQPIKNRFSPSDMKTEEDFSNMGPAEQELWETCLELNVDKPKSTDSVKNMKLDLNINVFTPIQEENDRSISVDPKDFNLAKPFLHSKDNEQVAVALAELNNAFYDYLSHTEDNFDAKIKCSQLTDKQNAIHSNKIVDSASEKETDVMRHKFKLLEGAISEVQSKATELDSASQGLHPKDKRTLFRSEGRQSSIVLEKKKYWDQKIKEIEDISKQQQQEKKRKVSIKHNKNNDSLTRRKGKQIVKNFLHAGDSLKHVLKDTLNIPENEIKSTNESYTKEHKRKKEKRGMKCALLKTGPETTISKEKTKNTEVSTNDLLSMNSKADIYFGTCKDKYEQNYKKDISYTENESKGNNENSTSKVKQEKGTLNTSIASLPINVETTSDGHAEKINSLKQDYTEEVFKAFETCPKRFFGTSRKRILNKIDSFLGIHKPTDEMPSLASTSKESGIVSNRVTLFHSISNVEELVWKRKNFQNINDANIVKTQVLSQTTNEFKNSKHDEASDASVLGKKETNSKVREDKLFEAKREKPNITYKDSHSRHNLHYGKKTLVTKTQETNKLNDIMTTQANLKSQVNDAIRRLKINDPDCNDTPVENSTTKVVEHISKYQNNGNTRIYSEQPIGKIEKSKNILRKSSFSRSDMDIFQKVNQTDTTDDLDKHKSYEDLPKIDIKNFISIFETATKNTESPGKPVTKTERLKTKGSSKGINDESVRYINQIPILKENPSVTNAANNCGATPQPPLRLKKAKSLSKEKLSNQKINENLIIQADTTDENYISLNDIDIEIIEKPPDTISEVESDVNDEFANPIDYKSRFNKAKDFFKSLEELRDRPVLKKEKACTTSIESLDSDTQPKNSRKKIKAFSLPSSEVSQVWDEMNLTQDEPNKLIKISEKFQVEHLFNDVVEGKLSRRGSLRGIPHKKAVLETFKSMENVCEPKLSPYEISISQLTDFAKKNKIINSQTYLTEYPYLPTTDPSKYHSRIDAKASGLISLKELVNSKPRRNSVPDLRLVPSSTLDL